MANNNRDYKDLIGFYRVRTMAMVGLLIVFLVGVGAVAWRWYTSVVVVPPGESVDLKVSRFEELWVQLQEKGTRVESGGEILYGGGVGKLEPFE